MKSKSKSELALLSAYVGVSDGSVTSLDLNKKILRLLMRATSDISLSIELLEKIDEVTSQPDRSYKDTENKIKLILQKNLDKSLLEQAELESINECQLAIIELMAMSHALAKNSD